MLDLTQAEMERYSRQINLAAIGITGQKQLKQARVLCIGAGALASSLLVYLAAAGVGVIGIMDDDVIELSNLARQTLYEEADIGKYKVTVMRERLQAINPHLHVQSYSERFNAEHQHVLHEYDIIADCSDNFATRYFINDGCLALDKPYVFASIHQFQGQCATFLGTEGPCLRCLFPTPPVEEALPNCVTAGVLGVLPGLLGIIQATEIIKWIITMGDLLVGRILTVDVLKMRFREFILPSNSDCTHCALHRILSPQKSVKSKLTMNEHIITPQELQSALKNNPELQLVDVRTLEKHEAYHIGGKHIPLDELSDRLHELNPHQPIVTYCTSGGKSMQALQLLLSHGMRSVKSLAGGMTAWKEENK